MIEYFQNLISSGTGGSYISLSVWSFIAISLITGLIFGLKRGFYRSVIRLLTVALSAVAAYFAAASIGGIIYAKTDGMTLLEMFDAIAGALEAYYPGISGILGEDMRALVGSFDAEVAALLVSLLSGLLAAPVVFAVAFYILRIASWVLYWLACLILGLSKRRTRTLSRTLGAVVGLCTGAVIAIAVLLPVSGFVSIAEDVRPILTADTVKEESRGTTEEFYIWWVEDLGENPALDVIYNFGGERVFREMTRMPMADKKGESATEEVRTVASIYCEAAKLAGFDWKAPSPEAEAALDEILNIVDGDEYAATLVSGVMRGISRAIETDALVIVAEEPIASLIDSIFKVFSDSSKDNVADDLGTVLHVYFILGDYEVLSAFDNTTALRDALLTKHEDGKTVIDYVVDELYLNPRTSHIVGSLSEISIKVMCDMVLTEEAYEIYVNVKTGVNDILSINAEDYETREEYVAAVSESLDSTLKENNIELDEKTLDNMSSYIAENYSDVSEITDEDVNRAILYYYNAYADSLAGGELPDELPDDIPELPIG